MPYLIKPSVWGFSFLAGSVIVAGLAPGCSATDQSVYTDTGGGVAIAQGGMGGSGGSMGTFATTGGNQGACVDDSDCGAGVCNNGTCCASAETVCGDGCCDLAGDVCLFNACVTPGDDCVSEADCPDDQYCEPALGDNMGQGGAGANCSQPLETGKCVPKPVVCEGLPSDPPDCIEPCEYEPEAGQLNATVKWQWGYAPAPTKFASDADVWSTPAVGRIFDANCDGKVDLADPPNIAVVSGNANTSYCVPNQACRKGVLRLLDGSNGQELWSLDKAEATSQGFAGVSVAIGDVDGDKSVDVVALTGEGKLAVVNSQGQVTHLSTDVVDGYNVPAFGWGGGLALGDMNGDGWPEIAYGRTVFTMTGGTLTLLFKGTGGYGGLTHSALSYFVDLTGDGNLELMAGSTAYVGNGGQLWINPSVGDGFTATADFDQDGAPEIVMVRGGNLYILEGSTGQLEIGPHKIPGNGQGGPPTVADFNGDGQPEIGVAMQNFYSMMKPNYQMKTVANLWSTPNHDNSSSVTGSSVFDFEGDGKAEVVYMDECFIWVYDGTTGDIRFTANSQSFTATETAIVADVDGDGHAEIVVVHNAANPFSWTCAEHTTGNDGYPKWAVPAAGAYRGITVYGDSANSWVGTRTLWNQHPYSVTNICDPRDSACVMGSYYGEIPAKQKKNWTQGWLNNFRQNVQDEGLFDAPDPVVSVEVLCVDPVPMTVSVRNMGLSSLPANVEIRLYRVPDVQIGTVHTTKLLMPGQTEKLDFVVDPMDGNTKDGYYAEIYVDPVNPTFRECRPENNKSAVVTPKCIK